MQTIEQNTQPATLESAIAELGLTIVSEFIPFSQSRNRKPVKPMSDRSMNWRVQVQRNGRTILESIRKARSR